ncbi:MAG: hypothetical protein JSS76_06940 [Bacteroidetes bacterium]|nr:hypothetical protein [Bacteroidota bacterium]
MKRIYTTLFTILILFSANGQAPHQMNYQAVVRNASGQTVPNATPVSMRFTIHDGSATGTTVFRETQNTTTNQFGLVNVQIGSVNTTLGSVVWSSGAKYLEVEVDVNNTGAFLSMGNTQLISVPYALYAANSTPGPTGPTGAVGSTGPTGLNGITGPTGISGANGLNGATGPTGTDGPTGATGAAGQQGPTGANGTAVSIKGSVATSSALPSTGNTTGDGYLTQDTGHLWVWDGVQWIDAGLIQGPQGNVGATGPQGVTGANGQTGPAGPTGPTGVDGSTGPVGATGPGGGATGPTGATGADGVNGQTGITGSTGATGPTGPTGAYGVTGPTGLQGPTGPGTLSGGINYVVKFTPNGQSGGNSQIYDDSLNVGIGNATPSHKLHVLTNDTNSAIYGVYDGNSNGVAGIEGYNNSSTNNNANIGVLGSYNSNFVYGVGVVGYGYGWNVVPNFNMDAGVYGSSSGRGVWANTSGGTALYAEDVSLTGYAAQLIGKVKIADSTQGNGRVLTSDIDGNASWQDVANPNIGFEAQHNLSVPADNTPIVFDTEIYDDGNGYDPTTGIYTVPQSGTYHFDVNILFNAAAVNGEMDLYLAVNSTIVNATIVSVSTVNNYNGHISVDIKVIAGDSIAIRAYDPFGSNNLLGGPQVFSHFTGHKLY